MFCVEHRTAVSLLYIRSIEKDTVVWWMFLNCSFRSILSKKDTAIGGCFLVAVLLSQPTSGFKYLFFLSEALSVLSV